MLDPSIISKYKSALMGYAILWVFFFHVPLYIPIISIWSSIGWGGVDVFLFLSAIGLSFSLIRNPDVIQFYKRRVYRIIPTWWILITVFLIFAVFNNGIHPRNIFEGLLYYTGAGWWINGCFDNFRYVAYEWYVPTLLLFYILTPMLIKLKNRVLWIMLICCALIAGWLSYTGLLSSIYWSYQRLPIFIFGIIYYRHIVQYNQLGNNTHKRIIVFELLGFLTGLFLLFLSPRLSFERVFELYWQRMGILLMMPMMLKVIAWIIKSIKLSVVFSFFGSISLEIYLTHIYCLQDNFHPFFFIGNNISNPNLASILILMTVSIFAFAFNKCTKIIIR